MDPRVTMHRRATTSWHLSRDLLRVSASELGAFVRSAYEIVRPAPKLVPRPDARGPAVVLVHGYLGHPALLRPLAEALLAAGARDVTFVAYDSLTWSIERILAAIGQAITTMADRHGPVDVVGHSLGAMAARVWIKQQGGAPHVRRFVALGGPHHGTALHPIVPSPVRAMMDPTGFWVRTVNQGPEPVPTWVVRARYDHQVFPPVRAAIHGIHEVVLGGHGHNGMLFAPDAHAAVVAALTRPEPLPHTVPPSPRQ